MADAYRKWSDAGANFHYLSASPWQLYGSLQEFIDEHGYPKGSFYLRIFRLTDSTFWDFFRSSEQFKLKTLSTLLKTFAGRRFILVGDAAERDPEIYASIAREFPEQVIHVYIREVNRVPDERTRMRETFSGVPQERWTLFREHRVLENLRF